MKRKGILLGLGLLSLSIVGLTNKEKKDEDASSSIRTIELVNNTVDSNTLFSTFEDCKIEESNDEIKITGLKKFRDFNISYDNVSEIMTENEFDNYVSFEYLYDKSYSILTVNAYQEDNTLIDDLNCYVFINGKQEKDALILCDGEVLLLSDIDNKYVENCGWFDKLIKSVTGIVVSAVVAPVVSLVSPTAGVATATAGAVLTYAVHTDTTVAVDTITGFVNLTKNKKQKEPSGYIYNQNDYSNWKFGYGTLDENGCGVIATYNALYGLGERRNLRDIIFKFETLGGKILGGIFGVDPDSLPKVFNCYNVDCQGVYSYKDINTKAKSIINNYTIESKEKWLIVCAWNGSSMTDGAHYVAARISKNGKYEIYNNRLKNTFDTYTSFDRNVIGGDLIAAYIIG